MTQWNNTVRQTIYEVLPKNAPLIKRLTHHYTLLPPPLSPATPFLPLSLLSNNVLRDTTQKANFQALQALSLQEIESKKTIK
tara:strand:- start:43883 stop:44128 length:246 start_codon:yes stop_codon:yes gene_type:complete